MKNQSSSVPVAILFSFLWLILFYVFGVLANILTSLLFYVLSVIPVINRIVAFIFKQRGDSPSFFILLFAPSIAYVIVDFIAEKAAKNDVTRGISLICTGAYLMLINIVFFVVNLCSGASFFSNILIIIAGIAFIVSGKAKVANDEDA